MFLTKDRKFRFYSTRPYVITIRLGDGRFSPPEHGKLSDCDNAGLRWKSGLSRHYEVANALQLY